MPRRRPIAVSPRECAAALRAIGDETRLRILSLLLEGPRCVSEIASALETADYATSRSLALLHSAGLVERQRDGHRVRYTIHSDVSRMLRGKSRSLDLGCCKLTLTGLRIK